MRIAVWKTWRFLLNYYSFTKAKVISRKYTGINNVLGSWCLPHTVASISSGPSVYEAEPIQQLLSVS